jgi:predicted nucleic acid-binding protein
VALIVDTNVFIDAENGRLELDTVLITQQGLCSEVVYMAAVTVAELLAGVKLAKTADEQIQRHAFVEKILGHVPVLDFDTEVARSYAELYAFALAQGKRSRVNTHDLQIAATALVYGFPVLSNNAQDFAGIPGIQVLNPFENQKIHEQGSAYGTSD